MRPRRLAGVVARPLNFTDRRHMGAVRDRPKWLTLVPTLAIFLIVFFATYGFVKWDVHRLYRMCAEIRPGETLADARRIASSAGLGEYFRSAEAGERIFDPLNGNWELIVPAPTSRGEMVCVIAHDGKMVTKAEIRGP